MRTPSLALAAIRALLFGLFVSPRVLLVPLSFVVFQRMHDGVSSVWGRLKNIYISIRGQVRHHSRASLMGIRGSALPSYIRVYVSLYLSQFFASWFGAVVGVLSQLSHKPSGDISEEYFFLCHKFYIILFFSDSLSLFFLDWKYWVANTLI